MNPFLLLLGLLGLTGAAGGSSGRTALTLNKIPASADIIPVIYDADRNIVQEIVEGESINLGTGDISGYTIGALVDGTGFESIMFEVNGTSYAQHLEPYNTPRGEVDLSEGTFNITITAHTGDDGEGVLLATETRSFDITQLDEAEEDDEPDETDDDETDDGGLVGGGGDGDTDDGGLVGWGGDGDTDDSDADDGDGGSINWTDGDDDPTLPETPAVAAMALVIYDADRNIIQQIVSGETIDLGMADTTDYTIGAIVDGVGFESVVFEVNGETYTQFRDPYNTPKGEVDLSDGPFDVTVTVYTDQIGQGDVLATETASFETTVTMMDDGGMDMGDDHDDGMDMDDDHDHIDHTVAIPAPGRGASNGEISDFLQALADAPETHSHSNNGAMAGEHMAAMDLVARGEATHVAIDSGDWFNPNNWSGGEVPGDDAKVLIPEGVTMEYGEVSDTRLFTVRVDGELEFATDTDSQMIFDTFIVSPSGRLEIGTENNPVDADVNVDLIVASNGRIDTDWDPLLLSRGLISHGETEIYGAEKDSHEKIITDPMKGDTSVRFDEVPEGWMIGDKIVIAGTHYEGWSGNRENYTPPEDEVRVITRIDDNGRVHFDDPLEFDHDSPRDDLKTSVANYTRNVSIETENGADAEIYERGHVMFMHTDEVDVNYAEFTELGRTDKSEDSFDVSDINNVDFDSNVQGRYSLHIHRAGTDDLGDPAILEGNAVFGSPGWGVVHHDSNALLTNNATYDTFGAGFVAETGNETGRWEDNIAIDAQGIHWGIPKNTAEVDENFDTARGGEGFWFQGRLVDAVDNVAASVNIGFAYFHRDKSDTTIEFDADLFDFPEALDHADALAADDVPIRVFDGNETFAANEGMHVVKANTDQGHDIWSHLTDFTAWSVETGAHLQYTSHYILEDFDVVGKDGGSQTGILFGNNLSEVTVVNATIDGFDTGIDLNKLFKTSDPTTLDMHDYLIIDPTFKNVGTEYENYNSRYDTITTADDLPGLEPNLEIDKLVFNNDTNRIVEITGEKSDSVGTNTFPGGSDDFRIRKDGVEAFLERDGYWTTSKGEAYFLVKIYFTDRATAEVFYENHPVYVEELKLDAYTHNGQQNIVTRNGETKAGDIVLDEAMPAFSESGFNLANTQSETLSAMPMMAEMDHSAHTDMSDADDADDMEMMLASLHNSAVDDSWMTALDDSVLEDGERFINTGDMSDTDLTLTGGEAVLATDGGRFEVSASRTLAIFEASAKVGFDGDDGQAAVLAFEAGSTLAYEASENGFATIEEFNSGAVGETTDVASGANLGNAMLSIDLTRLSATAGEAFTLMDTDEIIGIFEDATVGGLGARNAKIVVDYETDKVTLELTEGDGQVAVETIGQESDNDSSQALWDALTADQGIVEDTQHDHSMAMMDDDETDGGDFLAA